VIGFASIVGGSPSSVRHMTGHLRNQTLTRSLQDVARYYGRGAQPGTAEDRDIAAFSQLVRDGAMAFDDACRALGEAQRHRTPDLTDEDQDRLIRKLSDAVDRRAPGEQAPAAAAPRRDMHPLVARALQIDPDQPLADPDQINGLLAGRRADGTRIPGKLYAKTRQLPENPRTGERELSQPIGSYDFCPSASKSASVAWAFAAPAEQAMILNAHLEAARDAVAYIAREIGQARTGAGGEGELISGHVGWLEFTHYTARKTQVAIEDGVARFVQDATIPGDPDLHTHFLIPNAVFCADGRVGSLHTARIEGFIFEADSCYQARLAQNLRDAGFGAELDRATGACLLLGVPQDVQDLFSKRTKAGELLARQWTANRGEDWDRLTDAQRDARTKRATQSLDQKTKGGKDDVADIDSWRLQAKTALGWEQSTFLQYGPPAPELAPEQRHRVAYETALPFIERKLDQKSTIRHWDVRAAAGYGLVHAGTRDTADDINAVTRLMREHGVRQYGEQTALIWGQEAGKRHVTLSTALHESQEREFVALARTAAADRSAALPIGLLKQTIRESGLDFRGEHGRAQLAMIRRLGTGGRFGVAIAAAGAGKTSALKPLVAAWKAQGRAVYGASLGWEQADDLMGAGIAQRDVKAFTVLLKAATEGELQLGRNSVVAVDEYALLGTRQGLELLRLQARHGFQVIALGDPKQCTAIEAGNIVDLSRRAVGAAQIPEILTTRRQKTEREREIARLFREGRAKEALDMKRADGTAELVPGGHREVVERTAKLYAERLRETGDVPIVLAPTNSDAHALSTAIRQERRAIGRLGPDLRRIRATDPDGRLYDMQLAIGDRIRPFRSTRARFANGREGSIGRNRSVLEIHAIADQGLTVRNVKSGREGAISWDGLQAANGRLLLAYADALTTHAAQGKTAGEYIYSLPSGSQAATGLDAYSSMTRHEWRGHLLTSELAERTEIRQRRPLNDTRTIGADDLWANVARNFVKQPEKDLALAMLDRVHALRRGAVRGFAKSLQPSEQRRRRGLAPSGIHATRAHRAFVRAVRPAVQRAWAALKPDAKREHKRQGPSLPGR
jgi:conjugative relaxase-like TrwC/TraI family protein